MNYIPRIKRRLCLPVSKWQKERFSKLLKKGEFSVCERESETPNVVSFSCGRDLEEQVLCILSLLRWVGRPKIWTIYSDGSYSEEQIKILNSLGSYISVKPWDINIDDLISYKDCLTKYARQYAMGKKLCAYSTHNINSPVIFVDSDVVFYQLSGKLIESALIEEGHWFLPDTEGFLDSRYIPYNQEMYQVNGGFFLLKPGFSWLPCFEFINSLNEQFEHLSEQTGTHIAMRKQGGKPFDPRRFIISMSDQFRLGISYEPSQIALRHYVSSVRHKMWQYGWKWHLN